jgi:N-acetylneuraminic acid mutarotase
MKKLMLLLLALGLTTLAWAGIHTDVGAPDQNASEIQPANPPSINVITWTTRAVITPAASRLTAAAVGTKVYRIGGEPQAGGECQEYDPGTNVWTNKTRMPTGASNINCAVWRNAIYVPGGYTGSAALTTLQIYYPQGDTWSSGTPLAVGRFAQACAVVADTLYVIGGSDAAGVWQTECLGYDLVNKVWSTKAPMPTARAYYGAGAVNGRIYAVGGRNATVDLNTCEEFNPATNTWTPRQGMGTARGGVGVAAIGNRVYACGGGWATYLSSVEYYQPGTNTWTTDTPFTTGRRTIGTAALANVLYVIGGYNGAYSNVVESGVTDAVAVESPEPVTRQGGLALTVSPNPAQGGTSVAFSLPVSGEASLKVYDAQGRLVRTLVSGTREAGTYRASLGGLSAGVYFLKLQAGTYRATKSLVVVR